MLWKYNQIGMELREYSAEIEKLHPLLLAKLPEIKIDFATKKISTHGCGFVGEVGSGKTYAAACLFLRCLKQAETDFETMIKQIRDSGDVLPRDPNWFTFFLWLSWPDMANALRSKNDLSDKIDFLSKTKLLCLDDVGAERRKAGANYQDDYASSVLDLIIDSRYRRNLPTIWTSNLSIEEMMTMYGHRMVSRLISDNPAIELKKSDRRLTQNV